MESRAPARWLLVWTLLWALEVGTGTAARGSPGLLCCTMHRSPGCLRRCLLPSQALHSARPWLHHPCCMLSRHHCPCPQPSPPGELTLHLCTCTLQQTKYYRCKHKHLMAPLMQPELITQHTQHTGALELICVCVCACSPQQQEQRRSIQPGLLAPHQPRLEPADRKGPAPHLPGPPCHGWQRAQRSAAHSGGILAAQPSCGLLPGGLWPAITTTNGHCAACAGAIHCMTSGRHVRTLQRGCHDARPRWATLPQGMHSIVRQLNAVDGT